MLLRLAKSMTALLGAVGAPNVSGVTKKVPRSITSVFLPFALSAMVATVPPKPVPMTIASKVSCAAASLEVNAPSPAATAPTAALFTASRRVSDMRSFLVIVVSYCLVFVLSSSMVDVLYLAVCAHSYGYTQFNWFFDEPRQHLTVVGAGDALDGNR